MAFRYVFEIKANPKEDQSFIEHWREGSRPIQEYAGARGTRLYKKLGEEHTYVAIAEWESKQARDEAMTEIKAGQTERAKRVKKWGKNEDFGKVALLGELDEVDSVLPDKMGS